MYDDNERYRRGRSQFSANEPEREREREREIERIRGEMRSAIYLEKLCLSDPSSQIHCRNACTEQAACNASFALGARAHSFDFEPRHTHTHTHTIIMVSFLDADTYACINS